MVASTNEMNDKLSFQSAKTKEFINKVKYKNDDNFLFTPNINFKDDPNEQQQQALYRDEKTPQSWKNWESFSQRIVAKNNLDKAEINKKARAKYREKHPKKGDIEEGIFAQNLEANDRSFNSIFSHDNANY